MSNNLSGATERMEELALSRSGRRHFLRTVIPEYRAAQYPDLDHTVYDKYRELRSRHSATSRASAGDELLQGALGFYQFAHHAQRWALLRRVNGEISEDRHTPHESPNDEFAHTEGSSHHLATAQWLLLDSTVRSFIHKLYNLPAEYQDRQLSLLEVGTTSFILRLDDDNRVLKLVKPWHLDDREITDQTASYAARYSRVYDALKHNTPKIFKSSDRYIAMSLVEGETLHEYFQSLWKPEAERKRWPSPFGYLQAGLRYVQQPWGRRDCGSDDAESLRSLEQIVFGLCTILKTCAKLEPPVYHGDLSASNVIIDSDGRLSVIDFGINYLLSRNVGSVDEYRAEIITIDPAIVETRTSQEPSLLSDAYSLGVLICQGLLGKDYNPANDVQTTLDQVYERHIGIGAALDDLLERRPERRLPSVPDDPSMYDHIRDCVTLQLEAAANVAEENDKQWVKALDKLLQILLVPEVKDVYQAFLGHRWKERIEVRGPAALGPRLDSDCGFLRWAVLPIALNAIIGTWFVLRLLSVDNLLRGVPAVSSDLAPNIAGWTAAATSSVIATKYYLSAFATLPTDRLPRLLLLTTRLCASAAFFPILYVFLRDSHAWPVCAAVGMTIIIANNVAWHMFTYRARDLRQNERSYISPVMRNTIAILQEWWITGGIYNVFVIATAILLWRHILVDAGFYAIMLIGGANGKMYVIDCTRNAPIARTGLHRFIRSYRRASGAVAKGRAPLQVGQAGSMPEPSLAKMA